LKKQPEKLPHARGVDKTRLAQGGFVIGILIDSSTRVIFQGITGREGSFHARACRAYGTCVVAGVTPGKGGQRFDGEIPVFDRVIDAREAHGANAACIFVPPAYAADAIIEAADAGIELVICITEGVPVHDMMRVRSYLCGRPTMLIGPNSPGIITPGACKIGIMPGHIHRPGPVGIISRSGTLTYEAVHQLSQLGIGQSTCAGIGGDQIVGTSFFDLLKLFRDDPGTAAVVIIGEIGGSAEEEAAEYIRSEFNKPVAGFIAGRTAPPGRRMGHAGAIAGGTQGTAAGKAAMWKEAGVHVVESPAAIGETVARMLGFL
jgi:succinyl-CoA synthetase alpha subunit